jgi:NAD(P)-dependent dehydrogenase (short-subunit alcohol dehydrogenase family)
VPDYDINGKVALVTGAARGIGYEIARQLQMRGASVTVVDLDADNAGEAAERIGARTLGVGADVTDEAALRSAVAKTVKRFGGLDIVVANAGIAQEDSATVRGISGEEWERVFEVDMLGVWRTVRAAMPQVVERHGQMVVISSVYAFVNGVLNSPYAAAKSGVESLGRSLRAELIPLGASASVAYFGWIDTDLTRGAEERETWDRTQSEIPKFIVRPTGADEAAAAVVRGIEQRAPRIYHPRWWRYLLAARGILNPLIDRRLERLSGAVPEVVREIESRRSE